MPTSYTSLLGLALPVQGELQGTWGDTVNQQITELLDSAVAGTTTISTDADVTLTTTTGGANQSRQAIIRWTASGSVTRNITAPAQSKAYFVINATGGTQSIVFRGVGPTTGITILPGQSAVLAWSGSDFIKVGGDVAGPASSTDNAFTRFDGTTGKVIQNSTGATLDDTGAATFTGSVNVSGTAAGGADLKLYEDSDNGTNYVSFKSPASITTNVTWTLPNADGTSGQAIATDGAGNLSWISAVVGPASATDNAFARFDTTTGKLIQNSTGATLDDTGAPTFTGSVNVSGTSAAGADIKLYEDTDNGTNYVAFQAPATVASNVTWTLPSADGTSGQALSTNGSGTLSWSTYAPATSGTSILYGNGSGGFSNVTIGSNLTFVGGTLSATGGGGGITTGKSIAMAMIFGF
jgi:hypothetical protein